MILFPDRVNDKDILIYIEENVFRVLFTGDVCGRCFCFRRVKSEG